MTYYIKAAAIIARHPVRVLSHPKAAQIIRETLRREFRLHWLRDVAAGE